MVSSGDRKNRGGQLWSPPRQRTTSRTCPATRSRSSLANRGEISPYRLCAFSKSALNWLLKTAFTGERQKPDRSSNRNLFPKPNLPNGDSTQLLFVRPFGYPPPRFESIVWPTPLVLSEIAIAPLQQRLDWSMPWVKGSFLCGGCKRNGSRGRASRRANTEALPNSVLAA